MSKERTRFVIEVTAEDIAWGLQGNSGRCMLARAAARAIPDATNFDVDTQAVRFTRNGVRYTYLSPDLVANYVAAFDAGDPIVPFRTQLNDRHRMAAKVSRRKETPLGKALDAEYHQRYRARKAAEKAGQPAPVFEQAPREAVTERLVAEAVEAGDTEEAAREQVGAQQYLTTQPKPFAKAKKPQARVFKSKKRQYGARMLRVNWTDEQQAEARRIAEAVPGAVVPGSAL